MYSYVSLGFIKLYISNTCTLISVVIGRVIFFLNFVKYW